MLYRKVDKQTKMKVMPVHFPKESVLNDVRNKKKICNFTLNIMLLHWLLLVFLMYMYMTHHASWIQQIFMSYNFVWCGVGGWADFQLLYNIM